MIVRRFASTYCPTRSASEPHSEPCHETIVDVETRSRPKEFGLTIEDITDFDVLVIPLMVASHPDPDSPIADLNLLAGRHAGHVNLIGFNVVFARGIKPVRTRTEVTDEVADARFWKEQPRG